MRLYGGWSFRRAFKDYGWMLALVVAAAALTLVVGASRATNTPIPGAESTEVKVVAATGAEGFPVEAFCNDPLTKVAELPAPDASGITYQLLRIRDGKSETVVWTTGPTSNSPIAKHFYYDEAGKQQNEAAIVTAGAKNCIEEKAR